MELTQEIVRELLDYNPDTGELTWKYRDRKWFDRDRLWRRWNTRYANKKAGFICYDGNQYPSVKIKILGRCFAAHRVICLWMLGEWPEEAVDHIDRNSLNNKWANIRKATFSENGKNRSMSMRNTSGVTGVVWRKDTKKWRAQCVVNNKRYSLGSYTDIDEAEKVVKRFRDNHNFHPDHGLKIAHYKEKNMSKLHQDVQTEVYQEWMERANRITLSVSLIENFMENL